MGLTSSPSLSLQKFYPSSKVPNIVRFSSPRPAAHREVPLRLPGHTFFLPGRMSAADGRVGAVGGGRGSAFGKGPSTTASVSASCSSFSLGKRGGYGGESWTVCDSLDLRQRLKC